MHLKIGKNIQLPKKQFLNANDSKYEMKNGNKSPITNGNENSIRKWKFN